MRGAWAVGSAWAGRAGRFQTQATIAALLTLINICGCSVGPSWAMKK